MRIGIDIRELERGANTGIGRYLRNFIEFASQARPEYRFFVYGNQHTDTALTGGNVVARIAPERFTLWWEQVALPRWAAGDGVDLFLSPYIKGPGRVKCPLVVTIHDLLFLVFPEYTPWYRRPKLAVFTRIARWVGRRAVLILTDSEHSRRDIRATLGLAGEKIRVLPLGIEEAYRKVCEPSVMARARERYRIEPPYVFYLGNFSPHKNVQALLRAFARLQRGPGSECELVLGGREDHWRAGLRELAAELGLAARTRFIGPVAEEDLPALYSGARVFVFPSLYEGFGLPPLEAMACGTAVVASNRTSIPEVVGDGGWLVDPEDVEELAAAMAILLADEAKRRDLVRRGQARARMFRSADLCARQLELLEEVAAATAGPGGRGAR